MMAEHITLDALMQSSGHTALQVQEPASMETVRAQVEELSPEQKARVEEVKNSIDLMDSQAALQYGVGEGQRLCGGADVGSGAEGQRGGCGRAGRGLLG